VVTLATGINPGAGVGPPRQKSFCPWIENRTSKYAPLAVEVFSAE
jgi:hypothetical protein